MPPWGPSKPAGLVRVSCGWLGWLARCAGYRRCLTPCARFCCRDGEALRAVGGFRCGACGRHQLRCARHCGQQGVSGVSNPLLPSLQLKCRTGVRLGTPPNSLTVKTRPHTTIGPPSRDCLCSLAFKKATAGSASGERWRAHRAHKGAVDPSPPLLPLSSLQSRFVLGYSCVTPTLAQGSWRRWKSSCS